MKKFKRNYYFSFKKICFSF